MGAIIPPPGVPIHPLSVTAGGTGSRVFDPDMILYTDGEGNYQADPNFQYDSNKRQLNMTGGINSQLNQRLATQFDTTSTTLTNITVSGSALSVNLTSAAAIPGASYSGVYGFEAVLYTTSNVGGGVKAAISGTATATAIIYEGIITQAGTIVVPGTTRTTTLGTAVANVTAVTTATIRLSGLIVVSVAGTLTVQFACNAATGTSSVLVGSNLKVWPLS